MSMLHTQGALRGQSQFKAEDQKLVRRSFICDILMHLYTLMTLKQLDERVKSTYSVFCYIFEIGRFFWKLNGDVYQCYHS